MAFIYDVFRIKRKTVRTRSISIYIEDFIYWIIVAVVMFGVVYYSNDGELRGYIFIGVLIGVVLYILLLSKLVVKVSVFAIQLTVKLVKKVLFVITYPFRVILRILWIPCKFLLKTMIKWTKRGKRIGKTRLAKAAIWRKMFRNARKKI